MTKYTDFISTYKILTLSVQIRSEDDGLVIKHCLVAIKMFVSCVFFLIWKLFSVEFN